MKTNLLLSLLSALLLAAALSGCSATYIRRTDTAATGLRLSLGTDSALGELALADGKGATLRVTGHTSEQSPLAGKAVEAAARLAAPLP